MLVLDSQSGNYSGPYLRGVLETVLLHEYYHECLRDYSGEIDDCGHVAIYATAHMKMCEKVAELKVQCGMKTGQAQQDCDDNVSGICAALQAVEETVNTPEYADAAEACKNDPGNFFPMNMCGVSLPCPPAGQSSFPNNEVVTPCEACD